MGVRMKREELTD